MTPHYFEYVKVTDLSPGDLIDLSGDYYADPNHSPHFEYEYTLVGDMYGESAGELETPACYRLDYEGGACGFPPDHRIARVWEISE